MQRITAAVLTILLLWPATPSLAGDRPLLTGAHWDASVRRGINGLILDFGRDAPTYDPANRPYAVLDFDGTVSMGTADVQLAVYQLEHLRFGIDPARMAEVLTSGVPNPHSDLGVQFHHLSVAKVAGDIAAAYARLARRGWVSAASTSTPPGLSSNQDWMEFATKMKWLHEAILRKYGTGVASPWLTYWFTGMTPSEVYRLAEQAFQHLRRQRNAAAFWKTRRWSSPTSYPGRQAGALSVSFAGGMTVAPEMRDLIRILAANGIDVWICSSSSENVVNAALSVYGLPTVKGVLALGNALQDGRYVNGFDEALHPRMHGIGKADTVERLLVPLYRGKGPLLVAADSGDDFNVATEFADTTAVLLINRVRSDASGILAAVAAYQSERRRPPSPTEPIVMLQGCDENCGRFWGKPSTRPRGEIRPVLLSPRARIWHAMLRSGTTQADLIRYAQTFEMQRNAYRGFRSRGLHAPYSAYVVGRRALRGLPGPSVRR